MKENKVKNKIEEVIDSAMKNLKPLIDVDVVIGKTITNGQIKIIPLTKVTMGFISGGGEYNSDIKDFKKDTEYPFAGGSGAGLSLKPIAFLVLNGNSVDLIKIESKGAIEKLIEAVPEVAKFVKNNFTGKNDEK